MNFTCVVVGGDPFKQKYVWLPNTYRQTDDRVSTRGRSLAREWAITPRRDDISLLLTLAWRLSPAAIASFNILRDFLLSSAAALSQTSRIEAALIMQQERLTIATLD